MHGNRSKVTGVVLAGGLARRMGNKDKGLILFKERALISYAINALTPVVNQVIINANRNQETYADYGYPVISDITQTFDGPLAGVLSVMKQIETQFLLCIPCDCPLIKSDQLNKMARSIVSTQADVGVAWDGERMHPVFLILQTKLKDSLEDYLASGQRKIDTWLFQLDLIKIDFSGHPEMFINVNTTEQLAALEKEHDTRH